MKVPQGGSFPIIFLTTQLLEQHENLTKTKHGGLNLGEINKIQSIYHDLNSKVTFEHLRAA